MMPIRVAVEFFAEWYPLVAIMTSELLMLYAIPAQRATGLPATSMEV
jgi:hypothetical protein